MKLLVLKGVDAQIDVPLLERHISDPITINSYPQTPIGIAIIDGQKEIDWDWPDEVIKVGTVETGRHHVDTVLDANSDIESAIIDLYESTENADTNEDMVGS